MSDQKADITEKVSTQRTDFINGVLNESDVNSDPLKQFSVWLEAAFAGGNAQANAMVVSTVNAEGMPSSRVMLLRGVSQGGFTFFTNYQSRKGHELRDNPKASLLFFWPEAERQVRIQGIIEMVDDKESDEYFESRPFESKVGAWASAQSCVITDRDELDKRYEQSLTLFSGKRVPRPATWGGYVLRPALFEFWQGRSGRLHDRLQYRFDEAVNQWCLERLMP
jgi:pyridoxamine 5'-phosphate oxidase